MGDSRATTDQTEHGLMVYPDRGWRWLFFRLPFWLWRMGLARPMRGRFCMLTTTGRKSGQPRHTLLEYVALDGRAHLGAGWGPRSFWVRNLLADPRVTLESGLGVQRGRAVRVEDPDIMRRLYPEMRKSPVWDQYTASWGVDGSNVEDVAAKASQLWTFRIEPGDDVTPEPLGSDLWWVTATIVALLAALVVFG
jgi:deazaflavin-dependent oxidoreductase (nitroreductase family)